MRDDTIVTGRKRKTAYESGRTGGGQRSVGGRRRKVDGAARKRNWKKGERKPPVCEPSFFFRER